MRLLCAPIHCSHDTFHENPFCCFSVAFLCLLIIPRPANFPLTDVVNVFLAFPLFSLFSLLHSVDRHVCRVTQLCPVDVVDHTPRHLALRRVLVSAQRRVCYSGGSSATTTFFCSLSLVRFTKFIFPSPAREASLRVSRQQGFLRFPGPTGSSYFAALRVRASQQPFMIARGPQCVFSRRHARGASLSGFLQPLRSDRAGFSCIVTAFLRPLWSSREIPLLGAQDSFDVFTRVLLPVASKLVQLELFSDEEFRSWLLLPALPHACVVMWTGTPIA